MHFVIPLLSKGSQHIYDYVYIKLLSLGAKTVYHREINNSLRINCMQYLLNLYKPHSTLVLKGHY